MTRFWSERTWTVSGRWVFVRTRHGCIYRYIYAFIRVNCAGGTRRVR
jgi:hypothetical protein